MKRAAVLVAVVVALTRCPLVFAVAALPDRDNNPSLSEEELAGLAWLEYVTGPLAESEENAWMMATLLQHQRPDGLWGQLVDDPEIWPETSGSAMFAYAFIEGVKRGWLDGDTYAPAARKAFLALTDYIEPHGDVREVCCGTNVGTSREHYEKRPRLVGDLHGQAPLLWCCAALAD